MIIAAGNLASASNLEELGRGIARGWQESGWNYQDAPYNLKVDSFPPRAEVLENEQYSKKSGGKIEKLVILLRKRHERA